MNQRTPFDVHLTLHCHSLPPGMEWTPSPAGWLFAQIRSGQAYALHSTQNKELAPGTVLVLSPAQKVTIRASQISDVSLNYFQVDPGRLTGLVTVTELQQLEQCAAQNTLALRVYSASDPLAEHFRKLCPTANGSLAENGRRHNHNRQNGIRRPADASENGGSNQLKRRLQLLGFFTEVLGTELSQSAMCQKAEDDAKSRMVALLKKMPASELLELSFEDLVVDMRCTSRHVSRVFAEVVGMSFREKQTEVRLLHARELLATTNSKVLDVAMDSGYQSVSLFNLMFKKRFGVTPGKWRQGVQARTAPRKRLARSQLLRR